MEAVLWIVLAAVLAVAELFTLTFVLLMLAGGAAAAAVAAALNASQPVQVLVFALVSVLALGLVRPVIRRHRTAESDPEQTPFGLTALEGSVGLVLEEVSAEAGLVKLDGELWTARSYDATQVMEPGERVRVIEVKGATAMVWRDE
ncbi:NfeD family protein [Rhizomonospora bruguierae]|uniref:NfeD family protein n=1 Tax=Rhizomonospora bruguierae TaxID=1581705 RepID=UPI001BCBFA54|nr:NfeD family protein [Micromonospora sp. NBRC 107566]